MSKKLKLSTLLKEFKKIHSLDFRYHKYIKNSHFYNYKYTTYYDYEFAKKIVLDLNNFLIDKFQKKLVIYNLDQDIESLKYVTLKHYIEVRIDNYLIEKYNK